ncbi:flagellar biosynthetic protein FliP [Paramagnetospirillum marisnigri]|uniref:Flagellar biosynthetic protein FliP n=1 Tax=Paramagnetospirillum marisnigri TaxID=1285242 RepID=A0A178MQ63_9PROT|nr:flagellar type III secretion system pore protein FliP [Paramagnetospirillum marisnigri]OAN50225.1 flagellar biosynthetic protein FliP [Paramagnetospirillum marisnigri]
MSRRRLVLAAAIGLGTALMAAPVLAQAINIDLGGNSSSATSRIIQLVALTTVLSIAPSIVVMVTSFTRFVVVFGFLRQALGTMQAPPNTVLVSLAMFMTAFVMAPTFDKAWETGIQPMMDGQIEEIEGFERAVKPFHAFMMKHVRPQDLKLFMDMSRAKEVANPEDVPLKALIPSFMISELRRAFEIGFLIFLPFLIIDMVIASILMSMGMMMIPPAMISLPFKLIFFVLVDGWYLVVGSLVQSFG